MNVTDTGYCLSQPLFGCALMNVAALLAIWRGNFGLILWRSLRRGAAEAPLSTGLATEGRSLTVFFFFDFEE